MLDRLANALLRGDIGIPVVLDGQSILLEDYFQIRAEKQSSLRDSIQSRRLLIGPWYVRPHPVLAGPEALVRNLLIGARITRQMGDCLPVGYLLDTHEYAAQMPQILRGFGMTAAVVSTAGADSGSAFTWQGPDGTEVVVFAGLVGPRLDQTDGQATGNWPAALNLPSQGSYLLEVTASERDFRDPEAVVSTLEASLKNVKINLLGLPEALATMQAGRGGNELHFEDTLPGFAIPGSLSGRIQMKLRNQQVETLLSAWAEPFSAWSWLLDGGEPDYESPGQAALDLVLSAWKALLENHYAPTLAGRVVDGVYREALHRFDRSGQLAEELVRESLSSLTNKIATESGRKRRAGLPLVVFNPSTARRSDLAVARISPAMSGAGYELVDETGEQVAFDLPTPEAGGVRFVARDVPPIGYKTFFLREGPNGLTESAQRDEQPVIENEFLTVTFDPLTGLLDAFDKRTGRSFHGLNQFIDEGDSGTLEAYQPPARDTVIDVPTNTPIYVERDLSAVDQTLTYLQIYRLPRQLTEQRDARLPLAAQFVPVSITSQVRLAAGVPRIDIRASIANDAIDHRLRVRFALGSDIRGLSVDGHYQVRDLSGVFNGLSGGADGSRMLTVSQRAFVTLWGADTGLTIANRGLPEVTVSDGMAGGEASLTLIRSTGYLGGADPAGAWIETPLAQCLGEASFQYSVIPHGQDALAAWQEAWAFQAGLRAVETDTHRGALPLEASLVEADNPRFIISAVKTGEDGRSLIVRGYSISDEDEMVTLSHGLGRMSAQRVRLDETPTGVAVEAAGGNGFRFEVRPAQIVTIRLERR